VSEANDVERAYGCIFCVTGKEMAVAQHLEHVCEDVSAIVARQLKRKTVHGKTHVEENALYPGYIFFEASVHEEGIPGFQKNENIFSVLRSGKNDWRLYGNDAKFAEWLFSYDGLIPFSKAVNEGDRVRIVSGPLFDMQGLVVKFNKRHKSAQIALTLCNRVIKTWLQYEILDKVWDESNHGNSTKSDK
jgi:transcription antitermination factor NusG